MLGENIRLKRKQAGLSQEELGTQIGVDHRTISSYEKNRTQPSIQIIERLAEVFRCTKSEMLGDVAIVSASEREMLRKFRELDPTQQDMILASIDAAYVATKKSGGIASAS